MSDTTLYLTFPDEATFRATLPADFVQQGETGAPLPAGVQAIRIIGALYDNAGVLVPGYHVNALNTIPAAWVPYQVFPTTPPGVFG